VLGGQFNTLLSVAGGMVYFEEYKGLSAIRSGLFALGVSINILGVLVLAIVPPVTVTVFEEVDVDKDLEDLDVLVYRSVHCVQPRSVLCVQLHVHVVF
jgi:hypothetical protein